VALPDLTREFLLVFSSVRTRSRSVLPAFPCNVDVCKRKDPGIGLDRRDFSVENAYRDSTIADHIHLHQDCLNSVDAPGIAELNAAKY